ncbi:MAG: hypothetical protein HDP28_01035 [Clostridia bacterium]|nr:hypothetical protein [Clostridia bacterium]
MFWDKKKQEIDKLILNNNELNEKSTEDPSEIKVKIDSKEQLFSTYSYSGDKLNSEFSDYIFDKAKSAPIKEDIKIKIHTCDDIDAEEVQQTLKSHCLSEYKESKKEVKRIVLISTIMTVLGILALTALILINHFTDNLYITSIVEIAAWVFIWEAVDYFFLQRPLVKGKCILIQRIYMAQIEVCKDADKIETQE